MSIANIWRCDARGCSCVALKRAAGTGTFESKTHNHADAKRQFHMVAQSFDVSPRSSFLLRRLAFTDSSIAVDDRKASQPENEWEPYWRPSPIGNVPIYARR